LNSKEKYRNFIQRLPKDVILIAVSKTKTADEILELYEEGHRDFGENYVQELVSKHEILPKDIRWHFIGHLQSNKVKFIAGFINMIHSVDSLKLLNEINRQGEKNNRMISCLIQTYVGREETKFGLNMDESFQLLNSESLKKLSFVSIRGLMGMASNTTDEIQIKKEFLELNSLYTRISDMKSENIKFEFLSMGMSGDYEIAIGCGSNMIRVGSLLFGNRNYK
jgi:pyridoxal phosphate enzyme (YggS family)